MRRFGGYDIFFLFFFHTHLLSYYWTSGGHRCRSFFPPVLAFNFCRAHRVQQSHCSWIFHRVLLTHTLGLSAICAQENVPTNLYEYALGGARTHETDLY